ncbi:MAG TPA: hypothetical protein PLS83_06350 [Methanothrix soehngenii]|nr:hypothetical protein [Methanothrix soehngenii]
MRPYEPDYEDDVIIVEVKHRLRAIRALRAVILELASRLTDHPNKHAYVLLIDSGVSPKSLRREWDSYRDVFRDEISNRLGLACYRDKKLDLVLGSLREMDLNRLQEVAAKDNRHRHLDRLPEPDYSGEILRLMILLWLLTDENASDIVASNPLPYAQDEPPVRDRQGFSIKGLEECIGTSYRTVIRALDTLGPALKQYSDRSVALTAFPRMAWEKFVVLADTSRSTKYYADRSGQPRSPLSLMQRVLALNRQDLAIGGIAGAMRIFPDLDLIGLPRLDLHIHAPGSSTDLSFIRKLDPALKETDAHDEKPSLAIHFLRRKKSYFRIDADKRLWADPVECLIDLLTMRMDYQALQFRNAIVPKDAYKWPT